MEVNLQVTPVFEKNWKASKRFVINQGATRSSKTFSILQVLILKALESEYPLTISIVRKTLPALKKSVLRDFIQILEGLGIYDPINHNKTDNTILVNNTLFEFFSIDNAQKYRGSKRDILYVNEANELTYEDIFQLQIRTGQQIFLDYNPSDNQSWIYDLLEERPDQIDFIKSTYLDNPFLEQVLIDEIERLKDTDEEYYRIYALGERGMTKDLVYQYHEIEDIPTNKASLIALGLDWGYSQDPTALIEVWKDNDNIYLNEVIYERGLTNSDIASKMNEVGVLRIHDIVADSAEPKSIEELSRYGFKIKPALKGPDSINNGIDILKRYRIHVTSQSVNLIKEFQRYKWMKDANGNLMNKPIDMFNHGLDAVRYVALNLLRKSNQGKYNISILGKGEVQHKFSTWS